MSVDETRDLEDNRWPDTYAARTPDNVFFRTTTADPSVSAPTILLSTQTTIPGSRFGTTTIRPQRLPTCIVALVRNGNRTDWTTCVRHFATDFTVSLDATDGVYIAGKESAW